MSTREELRFDLVEGEVRHEIVHSDGYLSYAVAECDHTCRGTIVLLHGVGSNASRWEEFVEQTPLRKEWRILRMDLRGHGASESDLKGTLEQHAADIMSVLDDAGVKEAVLIGHSLGAQIAMTTAVTFPQRVCGLVLLDPLVSDALTSSVQAQKRWNWLLYGVEWLARAANRLGIRRRIPHYSLRQHDRQARQMLEKGGEELKAFIKEYSSPFKDLEHIHTAPYVRDLLEVCRHTPDLTKERMPILVIGASSGTFTRASAMKAWVNGLPMGTWCVVRCFHWPLTECPQDVSRIIERWMTSAFVKA